MAWAGLPLKRDGASRAVRLELGLVFRGQGSSRRTVVEGARLLAPKHLAAPPPQLENFAAPKNYHPPPLPSSSLRLGLVCSCCFCNLSQISDLRGWVGHEGVGGKAILSYLLEGG